MEIRLVDTDHALRPLQELLRACKLPYEDVNLGNGLFVGYYADHGTLMGAGGLEIYGSFALMRSVAVAAGARGKALGTVIVSDLLARARQLPVTHVYLLTETARSFFINRGFKDVNREDVPAEVKASTEFTSVCPVSAVCMVYQI